LIEKEDNAQGAHLLTTGYYLPFVV
jgi:hypothetical protein